MSTWPHCEKSKSLIRMVSDCEMTAFGIEAAPWSPRTNSENSMTLRINKLLSEVGLIELRDKKLYEKIRIIAHHLGITFWAESESESDSDDSPQVDN
jgi:hypothetical protein